MHSQKALAGLYNTELASDEETEPMWGLLQSIPGIAMKTTHE